MKTSHNDQAGDAVENTMKDNIPEPNVLERASARNHLHIGKGASKKPEPKVPERASARNPVQVGADEPATSSPAEKDRAIDAAVEKTTSRTAYGAKAVGKTTKRFHDVIARAPRRRTDKQASQLEEG